MMLSMSDREPSQDGGGPGPATDCRLFTASALVAIAAPVGAVATATPVAPHPTDSARRARAVLRTTCLLPAIRRAHPRARIWLTRREAYSHNPLIDRVLLLGDATAAVLNALSFGLALCPDKSITAGSLMATVRAAEKRGFVVDEGGAIVPISESARYLYQLGLDNEEKFRNQKSEQQIVAEAMGFPYKRDHDCPDG